MNIYRNFVTVTGQLYFCSSPIRLDSYNRCQFGCVYCFSRYRTADNSTGGLQKANASAFAERLKRVFSGQTNSALDEFLSARIPIQLGAMQDPFPPMELTQGATLDLMRVLNDYNYPTIISTKGDIFLRDAYSKLLESMNVYLRISAAGISERLRGDVDVGCGTFQKTLERVKFAAALGVPVSLRIQPVIPGFEDDALEMTERAASAGASHVSFEYLKIASENLKHEVSRISRAIGTNIWSVFQSRGITRLGKDYIVKADAKTEFLGRAKSLCKRLGIAFGAGDTEFIHCSDGNGCCSGSGLFLRNATQFRANFVGILSQKQDCESVKFDDVEKEWSPIGNVHRYLTSNSRTRNMSGQYSSWISLVAHRWNGTGGPYSPLLFSGVRWTGEYDAKGFKIYKYKNPL